MRREEYNIIIGKKMDWKKRIVIRDGTRTKGLL